MLVVALALCYILALSFVIGAATTLCCARIQGYQGLPGVPVSVLTIAGLVLIAVLATYLSFFMPLGLGAQLIVLGLALGLGLIYRQTLGLILRNAARQLWTRQRAALPILGLATAIALAAGTAVPEAGDSGLYHIQTIKWIEQYGLVPGLGNLHGMYAWNSLWYPLSALFGLSFLGFESLHVVNAALYLLATAYFLSGLRELRERGADYVSWAKIGAAGVTLFVYRPQIGSPATDLPVTLLLWLVVILLLERGTLARVYDDKPALTIVMLVAVYTATVKLSAFPLLFIWLLLLGLGLRRDGIAGGLFPLLLAGALLIPWVTRTAVLSGYLIYPVPSIDLLHVDWKLSPGYVIAERDATRGWSRLPGLHWRESLTMPLSEWAPGWFGLMPYNYKLVVGCAALITALQAAGTMRSQNWLRRQQLADTAVLVYLVAAIGAAYWFISAPDPRFGFGFLFIVAALPLAPVARRLLGRPGRRLSLIVTVLVGLYFANHLSLVLQEFPRSAESLLRPAPYPVAELETVSIDHSVLYLPTTSDQCWYAPLPCAPVLVEGLRLRGTTLQNGFTVQP